MRQERGVVGLNSIFWGEGDVNNTIRTAPLPLGQVGVKLNSGNGVGLGVV
jgi:hypothetical protein